MPFRQFGILLRFFCAKSALREACRGFLRPFEGTASHKVVVQEATSEYTLARLKKVRR